MIKSLSIVLPLYNEEKRLKDSFKKISKFLNNSKIKFTEVIFVDDGSTDNSANIILEFINNYKKKNIFKIKISQI